MRKLLILFLAAGIFVACNNDKKDDRRSSRDRDRESDDYRSKDREDDRRNTDYNDDRKDDRDDSYNKDNDDRKSSSGGWSSAEVDAFVSECVPAAEKNGLSRAQATEYCECMQVKIEKMYPDVNDAATIDMESPKMQQMVRDCAPRN